MAAKADRRRMSCGRNVASNPNRGGFPHSGQEANITGGAVTAAVKGPEMGCPGHCQQLSVS